MSDVLSGSDKRKRAANGHGETFSPRIDPNRYPEVAELLRIRTREEFESTYKIDLSDMVPEGKDDIPWKGIKNKIVAILGHIAKRKDRECSSNTLH